MRKNLYDIVCRYRLNDKEADKILKINFMLTFLIIAVIVSIIMAFIRWHEEAYFQVIMDGVIAVIAGSFFIWLIKSPVALIPIVRVMLAVAFLALYTGIFFATPNISSIPAIVFVASLAYLFFSGKEFLVWIVIMMLLLILGEILIAHTAHLKIAEFFVILFLLVLIILSLRISDKAKEMHKTFQLKEAAEKRNALLSNMIGSIAHQWRQPLGAITAITANVVIKNQVGKLDMDLLENNMHKIDRIAQSLSETIEQFKNIFALTVYKEKFSILAVIQDQIDKELKDLPDINISIEHDLENDDIYCNKLECTMSVHSVVLNAKEFLEKGGTFLKFHLSKADQQICLNIENDAGRIAHEFLDMIFDPYFSTKETRQGVGLGLYIAKTLMKKNDGTINVENTEQGVRFSLYLPTAE